MCYEDDKFVNNVLNPCGHNGYCVECLNGWKEMRIKKGLKFTCPICTKDVIDYIKMYDQTNDNR